MLLASDFNATSGYLAAYIDSHPESLRERRSKLWQHNHSPQSITSLIHNISTACLLGAKHGALGWGLTWWLKRGAWLGGREQSGGLRTDATQKLWHSRLIRTRRPSWWLSGKESTCNAGDVGLIPGLGRSPGVGNDYHSSILAWIIPWTQESGLQSMAFTKSLIWLKDWTTRKEWFQRDCWEFKTETKDVSIPVSSWSSHSGDS